MKKILEFVRRGDVVRIYDGICPTLQQFLGTGGGNVPCVMEYSFVDAYNLRETGNVATTITAESCAVAGHSGPSLMEIYNEANNTSLQGDEK